MPSIEQVRFRGAAGNRLAGVLHRPAQPRGSVLMAHCFTCSKDLHTMTRMARALADADFAVLRFDFTGLGESEGDFADKTVSTNVGDLVRAAAMLIERGYGPCALLGHSLGGAAVLLAAERLKTVRAVAVVGAPSTAAHVRGLIAHAADDIRAEGEAIVDIGGRPFPISRDFLDDLDRHDDRSHITRLGRPLLVVHAVDDATVDVGEGETIFAAARQPKGFVPLLHADHLLTDRRRAAEAAETVVGWFARTL
jgi:putative redox protein